MEVWGGIEWNRENCSCIEIWELNPQHANRNKHLARRDACHAKIIHTCIHKSREYAWLDIAKTGLGYSLTLLNALTDGCRRSIRVLGWCYGVHERLRVK